VTDPERRAALASPLWLHRQWHAEPPDRRETPAALAADAPIGDHLVPALRAFLDARRCSPFLALPHAGVASLDFLLRRGDPGRVYLARAAGLAGAKRPLLESVADLAVVEGDRPLAAWCWRRVLQTDPLDWESVADAAWAALPPQTILDRVVPDGRHALGFAERLFPGEADRAARVAFLRSALGRLGRDTRLPRAERLELEARAWKHLGERDRARERLAAALKIDPMNFAWRGELVGWLIEWGLPRDAHREALIGLNVSHGRPEARQTLERAVAALVPGRDAGDARKP
jgi:hypothetical protein